MWTEKVEDGNLWSDRCRGTECYEQLKTREVHSQHKYRTLILTAHATEP